MNTLLFDAGNSRFKWALVKGDRIGRMRATPVTRLDAFATWLRGQRGIGRVVGVSVAGARFERALARQLRAAKLPAPEFITSGSAAAGVRNAYFEPQRLGSDRWAAMIGAWHLAGRRLACAVSIGTAITLDVVDAHGVHRGGLIAPGPMLMLESLLGRTANIAPRASLDAKSRRRKAKATIAPLAASTREGIEAGCLAAAAGLVDDTVARLSAQLAARPVLFVTGGGGDAVTPLLRTRHRAIADLVLRGVAVLAGIPIRRQA